MSRRDVVVGISILLLYLCIALIPFFMLHPARIPLFLAEPLQSRIETNADVSINCQYVMEEEGNGYISVTNAELVPHFVGEDPIVNTITASNNFYNGIRELVVVYQSGNETQTVSRRATTLVREIQVSLPDVPISMITSIKATIVGYYNSWDFVYGTLMFVLFAFGWVIPMFLVLWVNDNIESWLRTRTTDRRREQEIRRVRTMEEAIRRVHQGIDIESIEDLTDRDRMLMVSEMSARATRASKGTIDRYEQRIRELEKELEQRNKRIEELERWISSHARQSAILRQKGGKRGKQKAG